MNNRMVSANKSITMITFADFEGRDEMSIRSGEYYRAQSYQIVGQVLECYPAEYNGELASQKSSPTEGA